MWRSDPARAAEAKCLIVTRGYDPPMISIHSFNLRSGYCSFHVATHQTVQHSCRGSLASFTLHCPLVTHGLNCQLGPCISLSGIPSFVMAVAPVSPERRKRILRVLFISLLLDLVRRLIAIKVLYADKTRYHSLSSSLSSRSLLSSIAILRHPLKARIPYSIESLLASMHTRTPFPDPSTIAMILSSLAAHSDPSSPSFRPSHRL